VSVERVPSSHGALGGRTPTICWRRSSAARRRVGSGVVVTARPTGQASPREGRNANGGPGVPGPPSGRTVAPGGRVGGGRSVRARRRRLLAARRVPGELGVRPHHHRVDERADEHEPADEADERGLLVDRRVDVRAVAAVVVRVVGVGVVRVRRVGAVARDGGRGPAPAERRSVCV
jgi:hypothetical protein